MMWNTLTPVCIIFIGFYSTAVIVKADPAESPLKWCLTAAHFEPGRRPEGLPTGHRPADVTFVHQLTSHPEESAAILPSRPSTPPSPFACS